MKSIRVKKSAISAIFLAFICHFAHTQNADSTLSIDLLGVPIAPGFTILGIEPTSIEEPATPTDLLVSVRNATGNFTKFPTDYALSFAPGWVFGGSNITYQSFADGNNVWQNIKQTALISLATHTVENKDTATSSQLGFGLKFSLYRGKIDEEYDSLRHLKQNIYASMQRQHQDYIANTESLIQRDQSWVTLDSLVRFERKQRPVNQPLLEALLAARTQREDEIRNGYNNLQTAEAETIKRLASRLKFERTGFKLDMGLGVAYDFADQNWEKGKLFRYGIWLNGGNHYKFRNKHSLVWLLTGRLLMFPDEAYRKENVLSSSDHLNLDFGGRLIYKLPNKLSVSTEFLSRSVLNNKDIPHTYRFVVNLDYQLMKNQVLTLSIGKDFDGTLSKNGNMIVALNLITGFGKQRPF